LPPIEQSLIEQEKALEILLGRTAQEIVNGKLQRAKLTNGLPLVITVPKILPSKLLERRPDIRAAEQNLIAGNAELEVVRAAYFPVISLTGLFGVNSTKLNKLFNSSSVNSSFGANATGSIIDFGQAKANVKIAEATKKQLLIQYQQTLRVAFQEVVNYLSAEQNSADNFKFFQKNEQALEEVMNSTLHRYNHGIGTYLDVLNAKQLLLRTKINKTKAKLQQLTASVNLFHALGGDWQN
jgi:multidrug efflux system outer membrane protein